MENQLTKVEFVALEFAKLLIQEQFRNTQKPALVEFVRNRNCYTNDREITERALRFSVNFLKVSKEYQPNG